MTKKNKTGMKINCGVCKLDPSQRHKLELELVQGRSYASIGREFGIDPYWVSEHSKYHVARRTIERSRETRARVQSINLIAEIETAMERLNRLLDKAERRNQHGVFVQAIQQLRGYHTLVAQMQSTAYQYQLQEKKTEEESRSTVHAVSTEEWLRALAQMTPEEQEVFRKVVFSVVAKHSGISE